MTLLILGAGGQFGTDLGAAAEAAGLSAAALDRTALDIADPGAVDAALSRFRPTVVVNTAAYTDVERAEQEPDAARRVNAVGAGIVAAACNQTGAALIHLSTDYVFDGRKSVAYTEDDLVAPLGVYAQSKAEGEAAVRDGANRHVILRSSWLYGVYGRNFLKTVLRLASERRELRVVADQSGCPTGTVDLAQAVLVVTRAIDHGENVWGTYHFAGTGTVSWHGFASEIIDCYVAQGGGRVPVCAITSVEYGSAVRRPANSALDSSKFAAVFGFRALRWQERTADVVAALMAAARRESVA